MNVSIWTITLEESLSESLDMLIMFLPKIIGAIALIVIGLIVGRLLAAGIERVLSVIGTDRISTGVGLSGLLRGAGITKDVSVLLGTLAYWVVVLLFVMAAIQTLGLATLSDALAAVVGYVPNAALAAIIVVVGLIFANYLRDLVTGACREAQLPQSELAGQGARVTAILLTVLMAVTELGVDTSLLNMVIVLLVAGAMGAMAISVGLGARKTIANMLSAYSVKHVLRVGQHVQVGELQGRVTVITPTSVVLETEGRRMVVPASYFGETSSVVRTA